MGLTHAGLVLISLTPFSLLIIPANRGEMRLSHTHTDEERSTAESRMDGSGLRARAVGGGRTARGFAFAATKQRQFGTWGTGAACRPGPGRRLLCIVGGGDLEPSDPKGRSDG